MPLNDIGGALAQAHGFPLILGFLAFGGMRLATAARMKILADVQTLNLSHLAILRLHMASTFYAMLLPGIVMGGAATWVKYVQAGASKSAALAAVLVNRAVGLTMAASITLAAFGIEQSASAPATGAALVLAILILVMSVIGLFVRPDLITTPFDWLATIKVGFLQKLIGKIQNALRGLKVMGAARQGQIAGIYCYAFAFEALAIAGMWAFAEALGIDLPLITICWLRGAVMFVQILPLAFLGLGVREVTLIGLTAAYGVAPALAVAWSLLIFAGSLLMALIGGLVELHALFRTKKAL